MFPTTIQSTSGTNSATSQNGYWYILDNGLWWLSRVSSEDEPYETKLKIILVITLSILTVASLIILCWFRGRKLLSLLCCNYYLCSPCCYCKGEPEDKEVLKEVTTI